MEEDFVVKGFRISGSILSDNKPLKSALFRLYKEDSASSSPQDESNSEQPLQVAYSDEEGLFKLENVPCGKYQLVPLFKFGATFFEISPKRVQVQVLNDDISFSSPFKVVGFTAVGKVLDSKGQPMEGVTILVDNKERAKTNLQGFLFTFTSHFSFNIHSKKKSEYELQMEGGVYNIKASKEHYKFSELLEEKVSSNEPNLPPIYATQFELGGVVSLESLTSSKDTLKRVELYKVWKEGSEEVERKLGETTSDLNGKYSFFVEEGEYKVRVKLSEEEEGEGVEVSPSSARVEVKGEASLNVHFSQVKVKVTGEVKCLGSNCHPSISVLLSSLSKKEWRMTTGLRGVPIPPNHPKKAVSESFIFSEVLPGKYNISIDKPDFCWQDSSFLINLTGKGHQKIVFQQTG